MAVSYDSTLYIFQIISRSNNLVLGTSMFGLQCCIKLLNWCNSRFEFDMLQTFQFMYCSDTLKQSYKQTFSNSFFLLCASDIDLKTFINMCLAMDQSLVFFWKKFLSLQHFFVQKCKNQHSNLVHKTFI